MQKKIDFEGRELVVVVVVGRLTIQNEKMQSQLREFFVFINYTPRVSN